MSSASSPSPSEGLAALTLELCRFPSVIREEAALCDWTEHRLRQLGTVDVFRIGNSVVACGPRKGRPFLGLFGHLDTVPAHPDDPEPTIAGDRIVGLGSSDMKAGVAIKLALLDELDLEALPYDVAMVFYDQEEGPFDANGLGPVLDQLDWLSELELGFCLEPSDNVVQVGAVGTLHAQVVFEGRACHSARPWQGENAVHKAGAFLTELLHRTPNEVDCGGFRFREVMSATLASGGRARNVIPEHFELNVNLRFAPNRSVESAQAEVRRAVGDRARVAFTDLCPAGRVVTDNAHLKHFLALTGADITAKQAWTDVARLTAAGIDAVNLGPGLSSQAHQAGEYCSIRLLEEGYEMFRSLLTTPV